MGKVVNINSGKDYKHLNQGDIPVYGTGGYMLSVNEALSDIDSVGIGRKGTINFPQYLEAPFWTVDTLFYVNSERLDTYFIYFLFQNIQWERYDESTGVPSLSKKTINSIKVSIPNSDEQKNIFQFFQRIEKLITLEQEKQNKYFSIYLSLRENSFPKNNESKPNLSKKPWRKTKMESIFSESTVRSSEGELLSVTISDGIKKASEVNKTDNSSVDKRNYKKVEKGDIVYNSMRLWQGAVGMSPYNGIVSPAYTVLKTDDFINQTFISQYFKTFFMLHKFKSYSQGLTSDQWNLKFPQLSTMGIYVPEKYIQNEIANILQTSYKLYTTQKNKIKELNKVKKKLLSEMFV